MPTMSSCSQPKSFHVKLQSSDGSVFDVPPHIYKSFKKITSMMEDPSKANMIQDVVPVPDVHSCSLWRVLKWAEYHMNDDLLEESNGHPPNISEWDRELLRAEKNILIEMVRAANHLGIQRLWDAATKAVLDLIKNQPPQIVEPSDTMDAAFIAEQQEKEFDRICMECDDDDDDDDEDDIDEDDLMGVMNKICLK